MFLNMTGKQHLVAWLRGVKWMSIGIGIIGGIILLCTYFPGWFIGIIVLAVLAHPIGVMLEE